MDATGDHHVEQNKSDSESQMSHVSSHLQILEFIKTRIITMYTCNESRSETGVTKETSKEG